MNVSATSEVNSQLFAQMSGLVLRALSSLPPKSPLISHLPRAVVKHGLKHTSSQACLSPHFPKAWARKLSKGRVASAHLRPLVATRHPKRVRNHGSREFVPLARVCGTLPVDQASRLVLEVPSLSDSLPALREPGGGQARPESLHSTSMRQTAS